MKIPIGSLFSVTGRNHFNSPALPFTCFDNSVLIYPSNRLNNGFSPIIPHDYHFFICKRPGRLHAAGVSCIRMNRGRNIQARPTRKQEMC